MNKLRSLDGLWDTVVIWYFLLHRLLSSSGSLSRGLVGWPRRLRSPNDQVLYAAPRAHSSVLAADRNPAASPARAKS